MVRCQKKDLQLSGKKEMVIIENPKEDQTAQKKHNYKNYFINIISSLVIHFDT